MNILAKYFVEKNLDDVVVISPDHGGTTRARRLAEALEAPLAIIDKRRPRPNVAQVMNVIGEVEGKNEVIIDDMVDTAGTLVAAVDMLKTKGVKDIYCCCTHPILSDPAIERISNSALKELVTTNTIQLEEYKAKCPKIVQLSVAGLIGQGILNIVDDKSVSDLFVYNKGE